jgi:acyl-CoA hydrolase
LPATASKGACSRIVPMINGMVTTPRIDVQYIITEYGIANLRGKSTKERALALINIAAPQFREKLIKYGKIVY